MVCDYAAPAEAAAAIAVPDFLKAVVEVCSRARHSAPRRAHTCAVCCCAVLCCVVGVKGEDNEYRAKQAEYEKERRMMELYVMHSNKEHKFRFDMGETIASVTAQIAAKLNLTAIPGTRPLPALTYAVLYHSSSTAALHLALWILTLPCACAARHRGLHPTSALQVGAK